jgi:Tfp pilus assembly protein PilZ
MTSRRRAVRRPRRVQVHFWRQGDPTAYIGYTTNISLTGMFIATNSPVASGSRVRVEVVDRARGFTVEGLVAHARKMQPELARLTQSGMGVRFLSVEELVRELIPSGLGETEEISRDVTRAEPVAPPQFLPPPPLPGPSDIFTTLMPLPPPAPAAAPTKPPAPAKPAPTKPSKAKPAIPVAPSGGSYTVRFSGIDEFLEVYERDILQGGLFVSTRYPAHLQETVSVELFPAGPFTPPVMLRARVVQRFEPDVGGGPNLLSGMGLELLDVAALIAALEPVVAQLKGPQP